MPDSFIQGSRSGVATLLPSVECAKTSTDLVHPNRTDLVSRTSSDTCYKGMIWGEIFR